jgi:hypothetical protein
MYGAGGSDPLSGIGPAAAIGATGTTGSVATMAYTGFNAMFLAVVAVSLLLLGFVLVRAVAHRRPDQIDEA